MTGGERIFSKKRRKKVETRTRYAVAAWILVLTLTASGCGIQRELNELTIAIGMGIDKDRSGVKLIAQIVKPSEMKSGSDSTAGSGGAKTGYYNRTSTGSNSFEAVREYTHVGGKLYLAHTRVFVIGKEAAEDGIGKYLDFFIRASETRPLTSIVVADGTAEEALQTESELDKLPAMAISKLTQDQEDNSQSVDANIQEYINVMLNQTNSFITPLLKKEKNMGKTIPRISGLAVFKKDKMVGQLDETESRGCLWVRNKVKSGVINLKDKDCIAAIEIKSAKTKLTPLLVEGKPVVKIAIRTEGDLATQTCFENLETSEGLKKLQEMEQKAIESEIKAAMKKTNAWSADIYGFGELFHKHYQKWWHETNDDWDMYFRNIKVEFDIKAVIISAGTITQPIRYEKDQ